MQRKIKMLIVEDNEDERLFLKEGLLRTGLYEIVGEARNGNEMLELFQDGSFPSPDVILSDLNMPGKNGFDVIRDVKAHAALSQVPVIILTTAPMEPYAARCKKLGACAYYTKPDTFLEYRDFGERIYTDVQNCLDNGMVDYSSTREFHIPFVQKALGIFRTAALMLYNGSGWLLNGKFQQQLRW